MYGDLYKAWKSEKNNATPQPLPSDFYQRVTTFMKSLDDELSSADLNSLQSRLLVREKEITKRLLEDLKKERLHKIMIGAQNHNSIQTDNLIGDEIQLNASINRPVPSLRQEPLPATGESDSTSTLTIVRFIQDIPEIVGVDLRIYGPFKKEDVASLPLPNAQALEKQGAARVVEVKDIS
jgi:DNA replication factor GINS